MDKDKPQNGFAYLSQIEDSEQPIPPCPFDPDYAVHPGKTVGECIIWKFGKANGLSDEQIDKLSTVVAGHGPIDEELADWLADVFKPPKSFWMNLEKNYEDWHKRHDNTGKETESS
jgi:plasmid maintenance system antidote protein VapI